MYNNKTAKMNKFNKLMEHCADLREKQKTALQPFLEIAKDENLTDFEKIEQLYILSKSKIFVYGKKQNIKGGDLIFQITKEAKFDENKIFDNLKGVYFNITKNKAFKF